MSDLTWSQTPTSNHFRKIKKRVVQSKNVLKEDLNQYASNIQCLFINQTWAKPNKKGGVTLDKFSELEISPKLIKNGIVLVWSSKNLILEIIETMEAMKFSYIENICICRIKVPGLDYNVPEILDATDETKPVKKLSNFCLVKIQKRRKRALQ